jgi:hypothetical protein
MVHVALDGLRAYRAEPIAEVVEVGAIDAPVAEVGCEARPPPHAERLSDDLAVFLDLFVDVCGARGVVTGN